VELAPHLPEHVAVAGRVHLLRALAVDLVGDQAREVPEFDHVRFAVGVLGRRRDRPLADHVVVEQRRHGRAVAVEVEHRGVGVSRPADQTVVPGPL
jgi:hypothetical protein